MAGSTNFPTSLDSVASASPLGFGEVNNQAYTLSTAAHTAAVTTLTVASTSKFPSKGYLVIKREIVSYTGTTATTFTGCTRGVGGTTAAAFGSGTLVEQVPVAANHNDLAAAIVAVETKVGITSSTPTANKVLRATGTGTSEWAQVATGDLAAAACTQSSATTPVASNQTTTSTTLVDVPDMSITLTTTGGNLLCFFTAVATNLTNGIATAAGFDIDGADTTDLVAFSPNVAGEYGSIGCTYLFTGVSAGSHTVKAQYRTNATGTASVYGRQLVVVELKR